MELHTGICESWINWSKTGWEGCFEHSAQWEWVGLTALRLWVPEMAYIKYRRHLKLSAEGACLLATDYSASWSLCGGVGVGDLLNWELDVD